MRVISPAILAIIGTLPVTAALADSPRCVVAPHDERLTIEAVIAKADALGYRVRSAKTDKGCWKVKGFDRNGWKVEIVLDPVSGEPVGPSVPR